VTANLKLFLIKTKTCCDLFQCHGMNKQNDIPNYVYWLK